MSFGTKTSKWSRFLWPARRDSNPRHPVPKTGALSTELRADGQLLYPWATWAAAWAYTLAVMRTEYTHEDGDEVLRRAIAIDALETNTKDVVRRTAAELGVSEAAVERAEQEYFKEKANRAELEQFAADQRKSFFSHLGTYLTVNAFLIGINLVSDGRIGWAIYPLLGWGLGVAMHAIGVFNRKTEDFQKQFEEWKRMRKASERDEA